MICTIIRFITRKSGKKRYVHVVRPDYFYAILKEQSSRRILKNLEFWNLENKNKILLKLWSQIKRIYIFCGDAIFVNRVKIKISTIQFFVDLIPTKSNETNKNEMNLELVLQLRWIVSNFRRMLVYSAMQKIWRLRTQRPFTRIHVLIVYRVIFKDVWKKEIARNCCLIDWTSARDKR